MSSMLLTIALVTLSQAATAQEKPSPTSTKDAPAAQAEQTTAMEATPRRSIRVLQDPYDLASFYRAGGSSPDGWAGLQNDPAYRIAGFYRSQAGEGAGSAYGWSRFWVGGYGARRPSPFASYRRTIGENGDLFLMVPFLAPVGPISGAFFGY